MRARSIGSALARLGPVDLVVMRWSGAPDHDPPEGPYERVHAFADCADPRKNRAALWANAPSWLRTTAYDVVWFNQERVWLSCRDLARGALVVDVDDLSDVVLRRWMGLGLTEHGLPASPTDATRMRDAIGHFQRLHAAIAGEVDAMVFSSEVDRARYPFNNAYVAPNVYEGAVAMIGSPSQPGRTAVTCPQIIYPGYLEWPTNEDAAVRLATCIAPIIRREIPGLIVRFVGSPSQRVQALDRLPGVEVTGEVPDMTPYFDGADVLVAPLRVGGGSRIKLLEAFARRLPVVTTPIGAEGLDILDGMHALIAASDGAIANACVRVLGDPDLAASLVAHGAIFQDAHHRQRHADAAVYEAAEAAVRNGAARGRSRCA